MEKKVFNARLNYVKPQLEVVDLGLKEGLCQNVVTQSVISVESSSARRFHVFGGTEAQDTGSERWGSWDDQKWN